MKDSQVTLIYNVVLKWCSFESTLLANMLTNCGPISIQDANQAP
jgi:hypothetical protein